MSGDKQEGVVKPNPKGQRTLAIRVDVPMHKRPRLLGLLVVVFMHVLLEVDRKLGGTLHGYLMSFYEFYRSCPFLTIPFGGFCVLILWPKRWKLVAAHEHEREQGPRESKEGDKASETNTRPFPTAGGMGGDG